MGPPGGYEGKHARREAAHFLHEPLQFAVVLDPLLVEDKFVFGEPHPDGFPAVLACPVVVGTVPGVRVAVAAAGGLPTRYPAGWRLPEEKPKRLRPLARRIAPYWRIWSPPPSNRSLTLPLRRAVARSVNKP